MATTTDVTISYYCEMKPEQTDSAFYCWSNGWETLVTVKAGKREFIIGVNGEMRLDLPNGDVWRYTDDLLDNKIDTDEKLYALDRDVWTNNNWFEMYEIGYDDSYDVFDSINDAIQQALALLNEEK